MLPNCSEYKRRLLRMKTLCPDFELAHAATPNSHPSDLKTGSVTGQHSSVLHDKEKIHSLRASSSKYDDSSELWMRRNPRRHRSRRHRSKSAAAAAQARKLAPLQQPLLTSTVSDDAESDMETQTCLDSQTSLLDCQTNNSRRGGSDGRPNSFGRRGGVTTAVNNANSAKSPDQSDRFYDDDDAQDQESTSESELDDENSMVGSSVDLSNENAVAKGSNALVKQSTSRQTLIIDTSKLLEEGKVETQYEEPEEEAEIIEPTDTKLIEEYEKTFAYARRLRALLNMQFNVLDRSSIETNFLLVKAHEHPTQKIIDRWQNVDLGSPYDGQIRQQKLIDDFKAACASKKAPKKGEVRVERYPEWLKFYIRFRRNHSDQRWLDYIAYKQKLKKASGGKLPVPKPAEKYSALYYDVWSTSIVVFAKPNANLQCMVDPVFAKLGLEARADFKFTIGCFIGDTRTGKAKIPGGPSVPEEVTMQITCVELYKRNCNEVFVNDNRVQMFETFPTYFLTAVKKRTDESQDEGDKKQGKKDKKGGKKKAAANQSNMESENDLAPQPDLALARCLRSNGRKRTKSDATESRYGDTLCSRLSEAVEEFENGSSPSATNQNLSVHDYESSHDYESQPTVYGGYTTTKSGRSETTKKDSN